MGAKLRWWEDDDPSNPPHLNELRGRLREAINNLPPKQRSAIELWALGYTIREIARLYKCSESQIKQRIYDAKVKIRSENLTFQ